MDEEGSTSGDEDPIVKEVDVYLSKQLADQLMLFQYPVRPSNMPYDDITHLAARIKPNQQKVELELALNTNSPNYARSKGEQIALNVDGPDPVDAVYASEKMDKQLLTSVPIPTATSRYVAGVFKDGELHLTPLKGVIQMHPSFSYLDQVDNKQKEQGTGDGPDVSQDEEEDVKPVMVRFARRETEEAKQRRMASYDYINKRREEEPWVHLQHHQAVDSLSEAERRLLFTTSSFATTEFQTTPDDYLKRLIPKMEEEKQQKPAMPTNVLSMTELKTMNLNDQIKALLTNAKVIKFSQLLALLPKGSDPTSVLRSVQQVAVLVQGCWVVKSDILYPKDSFSAHSGVPAETLCRGRDYVMWRFTQNRQLVRKDISSVIKLPAEDVKDVLEQMSRLRVSSGWEFLMDYDSEFVNRHPDVVQRQQMLWDAKFQQLSKVLRLSKADIDKAAKAAEAAAQMSDKPKRRRTTSRSRTKSGDRSMSDQSDTDMDGGGKGDRSRRLSGSPRGRNPSGSNQLQQSPTGPPRNRHPSGANQTQQNSTTVSMDISDGRSQDVAPQEEARPPPPAPSNGPSPGVNIHENNEAPAVDVLHLKKELIGFVQDKLCNRYVLTSSDLRRQFNLKLTELPPGHVLGTGVSDKMLEQTVYEVGGIRMNQYDEPLYVLSRTGDSLDHIRAEMLSMFSNSPRIKSNVLRKKLEESTGDSPPDNDVKKVLKDYCTSKGGCWYLKGTIPDDS